MNYEHTRNIRNFLRFMGEGEEEARLEFPLHQRGKNGERVDSWKNLKVEGVSYDWLYINADRQRRLEGVEI